jgi:hypothetical protein
MAGEVLLINPRRRRARRKRARAGTRKRRASRRRRNPFAINPRRRRRRAVSRRRTRRGRARRNPRLPLLGSVNITAIGAGAAGYIGSRYATGWLLSMVPPAWVADPNTAPLVRIGLKAAVGIIGLPMLARTLKMRGVAGPLAIGAGIAVAVDLFETYLAKAIPIPMSDYEQGYITAYEPGTITDVPGMEMAADGAYGGGAF